MSTLKSLRVIRTRNRTIPTGRFGFPIDGNYRLAILHFITVTGWGDPMTVRRNHEASIVFGGRRYFLSTRPSTPLFTCTFWRFPGDLIIVISRRISFRVAVSYVKKLLYVWGMETAEKLDSALLRLYGQRQLKRSVYKTKIFGFFELTEIHPHQYTRTTTGISADDFRRNRALHTNPKIKKRTSGEK